MFSDDKGELRIETVGGKRILTAKDPQGRLLFSGPVETQEDIGKIPADVRERFDKLQQKDLPSVISEGAAAQDEEDSDSEDMDEDDDNSVGVEQISVPTFPVNFSTFRTVLL